MPSASQYTASRLNIVCQGPMGPTGPQGPRGEQGPTGNTGSSGELLILGYSVETSDTTAPIPIPAGATRLRARIVGGGGGGGGGWMVNPDCVAAGGGGGSGLRYDFVISDIPSDSVFTISVGTGGAPGDNNVEFQAGINGDPDIDAQPATNGITGGATTFEIVSAIDETFFYKFRAEGGSGGRSAANETTSGNGGAGFTGGGGGGGGTLTAVGQGGIGKMMDGYSGSAAWGGSGGIGGDADSGMNGSRGTEQSIADKNQYDTGDGFLQPYGGAGGGPYGADSNGFADEESFLALQVTNADGILGGGGAGSGAGTQATAGGNGYIELEWLAS